jgi:hypothetical protein
MKGRKIEDQVKLTKFLLNYAEAAEEDGIIVALNQENAYDRINHDYLLSVLQTDIVFVPSQFINGCAKRKNQGQKEESDREGEIQEHRDAMENSKDSGNLVRPNLNTRCSRPCL